MEKEKTNKKEMKTSRDQSSNSLSSVCIVIGLFVISVSIYFMYGFLREKNANNYVRRITHKIAASQGRFGIAQTEFVYQYNTFKREIQEASPETITELVQTTKQKFELSYNPIILDNLTKLLLDMKMIDIIDSIQLEIILCNKFKKICNNSINDNRERRRQYTVSMWIADSIHILFAELQETSRDLLESNKPIIIDTILFLFESSNRIEDSIYTLSVVFENYPKIYVYLRNYATLKALKEAQTQLNKTIEAENTNCSDPVSQSLKIFKSMLMEIINNKQD